MRPVVVNALAVLLFPLVLVLGALWNLYAPIYRWRLARREWARVRRAA